MKSDIARPDPIIFASKKIFIIILRQSKNIEKLTYRKGM